MPRRARPPRFGAAMAASLVLHAAAVVALTFAREGPPPPQERVYAVDIVSPPPNVAGERPTEAPAPAPPAEAEAEPVTEPEPEPEPAEPEPAPPREPAEAEPAPRREPPKTPATPPERPKDRTPPAQGSGTTRQPAAGPRPEPASPGGEGIRVRTPGDPCPVAGYCENVAVTVQRFFRPPAGSAGAVGEVCFRVLPDGGAAGMRVARLRGGSAAFRLAMLEAVEAAGQRRAFGALPAAFDPQVPWCVELSPS